MSFFDEPKVDCHNHIFDPARFPYEADTFYRPAGQECGSAELFLDLLDTFNVRHALVVGPNSGYGSDNRCLLDAVARSGGRWRGIAVVPNDAGLQQLAELKAQGIAGVAFNVALHGVDHYAGTAALIDRLAQLGLLLQLQAEKDQWLALQPLLDTAPVRLLVDHCGRPDPAAGISQPGFAALCALGRSGRAWIKLSGLAKFSQRRHPHEDAWPYVQALAEAFTPARCVWGSDWPYLRAPERVEYGPQLRLMARLFPDPAQRRAILWETPCALLGWDASAAGPQR